MRLRYHKFCCLIHSILFLLLFFAFYRPSDRGVVSHADTDTLRFVDAFLDEALRLSLSSPFGQKQNHGDPGSPTRYSENFRGATSPLLPASPAAILDAARAAQLCQILRGKTVLLVGPRETLYQLHSFLLTALHPPRPGPTARASCPGPSSCPFHPLCHPLSSRSPGSGPLAPADVFSTNTSLMRFVHSTNLNPSPTNPTPTRGDPRLALPSIDPRTGVRVVDSRWVRHASSKADVLVLNRAPLSAPAWSYNNASARDWSWLSTLGHLEKRHAEPLSELFADVLFRLGHHDVTTGSRAQELLLGAALHSTVSTFLPSLLSTLIKLREHVGHRAILGKKPVLWYGSWYLPVSCAPGSVSVFSSENDPRRLLVRLLAEAEVRDNPWSAYYNAQGLSGRWGEGAARSC
ncbi:hypothetical protein BJV78DRAFT_1229251 [Lactifluus subvellereus]|nr:hypothetical protein BJV78DRAFT_1229251 [Lactifluus subvellereus]